MRRLHAATAFALPIDGSPTGLDFDEGADCVAVAASTDKVQADPSVGTGRVIAEDGRCAVLVIYDDVDVAVVIKVAKGRATGDVTYNEKRAWVPNQSKSTIPLISPDLGGLSLGRIHRKLIEIVVNVTVDGQDIGPAVTIQVGQSTPITTWPTSWPTG